MSGKEVMASVMTRSNIKFSNNNKYCDRTKRHQPVHETERSSVEIGIDRAVDDYEDTGE